MKRFLIGLAGSTILAGAAYAHHGSAGQFDMAKEMSVTGTITDIKLVNPHSYVYFDVIGDDGEVQNWRCELSAGATMRRNGWSKDMFVTGESITIDGRPARREKFGCYTEKITFADGTSLGRNDRASDAVPPATVDHKLVLADGTPNFAGNWAAARPQRGPRPGGAGPGGPGAGGPPGGGPGAGGPPQGGQRTGPPRDGNYTLTAAGEAASQGFDRERDNPRFHCKATNIVHDLWFDQHVNVVEQTDDTITIKYGFMDIVRTIHLDMDEHPDDIVPTRAGHSIGKWDGDTLVVDTVGFEEGYLDGLSGVKHSDKLRMVERISLSDDGKSLTFDYTGEDPLYLSKPFTGSRVLGLTTAAYEPYECDDLTEEVVKGF